MNYIEITEKIANQIKSIALETSEDFDYIICSERIFMDDYLQQKSKDEFSDTQDINAILAGEPNAMEFANTIFFVIKVGGGQSNMAVSNADITINVLSEENAFETARSVLFSFISKYNFTYDSESGLAQAYFNPQVTSSQDSVYTGFRAMMSVRGFIRVPETGLVFVNKISIEFQDDDGKSVSLALPFLNLTDSYNAQPDPQAFAGYQGRTMALIRQSTETIQFSTYLTSYTEEDMEGFPDEQKSSMSASTKFAKAVLGIASNMNRKFFVTMSTAIDGLNIVSDYFVLVGRNYTQELAGMDAFTLAFAMAKEAED